MDSGRLQQIATKVAGEKPLTPEEKKELARANIFVMDFEADGGTLPSNIDDLASKQTLSPSEARSLIEWAKGLTPGNFWD